MNSGRKGRSNRGVRPVPVALGSLLLAITVACGGGRKLAYSPAELRAAMLLRVPAEAAGDLVVPYQVTPELLEQARDMTKLAFSEHDRATMLLEAVTDDDGFGLRYEAVSTTPAAQAVARGHGNCLTLTSFYVGLARGIGLTAYYVDASDRVNDLRREEELIVDSGHIAAAVRTERGWSMVDFDGQVSDYRTFKIIDDIEALAHFYNNRGYEILHDARIAGDEIPWDLVRRDFELAINIRTGFARAHNNLGVAYTRLGRHEEAEASYRTALTTDSGFAAPYHNLANLMARDGRVEEALEHYRRAIGIQGRNPYAYYHYGLAQYRAGDADGAIESLKRAIRLKGDFLEPRNVLAQLYRSQGRDEEAEQVLRAIRSQQDTRGE